MQLSQVMRKMMDNDLIQQKKEFLNIARALLKRVESNEFRVAIVGEFSAGKSTFINSIMGEDLLKHATRETTATITYIHNVTYNDMRKDTCQIKYNNGTYETINTLNLLQEYTTTMSSRNVVNEIESVTIFKHFIDTTKEVVLIDTPGLNGIADKHREITIEEIKQSHACIYVLQKRGITETDIEFIHFIKKFQSNFIFVQNFIDELKVCEGDTIEDKLSLLKETLEKEIFGNQEKAEISICGVSALKALAGRDSTITRLYEGDLFDITPQRRNCMLLESNFAEFEGILLTKINDINLDYKRYINDCMVVCSFLHEVISYADEKQMILKEGLKNDSLNQNLDKAIEKKKKLEEDKQKIVEKMHNLICSQFSDMRKLLFEDIKTNVNQIEEKMYDYLEKEKDYEIFEKKYVSGLYRNKLYEVVDDYKENLDVYKQSCYQNVFKIILSRLNEYTCYKADDKKIVFHTSKLEKKELESKSKRAEIAKLQNKMMELQVESDSASKRECRRKKEADKVGKEIIKKQKSVSDIKKRHRCLEQNLGARPEKKLEYRTKVSYEQRTGVGRLFQWAIGKKRVEKRVPYYTDVDGLEWDKKKRTIKAQIDSEREMLLRDVNRLRDRKTELESKLEEDLRIKEMTQIQINSTKKMLAVKQEQLIMYEGRLKKEYLKERVKQLKREVNGYLLSGDTNLLDELIRSTQEELEVNIDIIKKQTVTELDIRMKEELLILDSVIEGNTDKLKKKYTFYDEAMNQLKKCMYEIEGELTDE